MIENVWIFDRRVRLRSQWLDKIDTNRQELYYPDVLNVQRHHQQFLTVPLMMKFYLRNVWVIKFLSICIVLILSLWSETHSLVKNSNTLSKAKKKKKKKKKKKRLCVVFRQHSPLTISYRQMYRCAPSRFFFGPCATGYVEGWAV